MDKKGDLGMILVVSLLGLILVLGAIYFFGVDSTGSVVLDSPENPEGRVLFTVTDAAADMGSVNSIKISIENVEIHSSSNGWVSIGSGTKTFDLLELKKSGNLAVLTDTELDLGSYDQIRFEISDVVVTDSKGTHEAEIPSEELEISSRVIVESNSTATANIDFIVDESLHSTAEGIYLFAPVIEIQTRKNAEIDFRDSGNVKIEGGSIVTDMKVGMDEKGNVGIGLKIPSKSKISFDSTGIINVGTNSKVETSVILN